MWELLPGKYTSRNPGKYTSKTFQVETKPVCCKLETFLINILLKKTELKLQMSIMSISWTITKHDTASETQTLEKDDSLYLNLTMLFRGKSRIPSIGEKWPSV